MTVRLGTIRLALSRGMDTLWIAQRYGVSEADVWNRLARALPESATDMPPVAGRLAHETGHSSPETDFPEGFGSRGLSGGVIGGLVHAKAQLREFDSGENAKLFPVVRHVNASPGASKTAP